jgi:hypothetical protein
LDLLPPQPTPPRALEPVVVGRVGKTAFDQMLAPPPVASCRRTVRRRPTLFQNLSLFVPADRARPLGSRALGPQRAARAGRFVRGVFPNPLSPEVTPPSQELAGRT